MSENIFKNMENDINAAILDEVTKKKLLII